MIFEQFKDATKKDQSKKKEIFTNRIEFLKTLKDDIQKNPKNFDYSPTQQQLQNLLMTGPHQNRLTHSIKESSI